MLLAVAGLALATGVSAVAAFGRSVAEVTSAQPQYSLSLNGTSAYVSFPASRSLELAQANAFTVAFRVLLRSYSNNVLPRFWEKGPQYLCVMGDPTNSRFREIGLEVQNASGSGNRNGGATEFWGTTRLQTDRWYFVAVTFDGSRRSNQAQIYVDGAPESMATIYPWSGTLFSTTGKPWMIGRRTADLARQLDGDIGSMVVYRSALRADQIAKLYHGQVVSGAAASWGLDEGSGTTALDSSGNGNTGSIVDGAWVAG